MSAGVVVAVFFLIIMIYVGVVTWLRRRKRKRKEEKSKEEVVILTPNKLTLEGVCRGCDKCQHPKIQRKHFPPRPAFEKRNYDPKKKPED